MLNHVIRLALQQRVLVLASCVGLVVLGTWQAAQLDIDVFPDLDRNEPMKRQAVLYRIKRIAERAGIHKNVFPYLFRHSTGSKLYDRLPEQIAKRLMGHTRDSRMPGVYSHGTSEAAINAMRTTIYEEEPSPASGRSETSSGDVAQLRAQLQQLTATVQASQNLTQTLVTWLVAAGINPPMTSTIQQAVVQTNATASS